jgi:hypothetical protein
MPLATSDLAHQQSVDGAGKVKYNGLLPPVLQCGKCGHWRCPERSVGKLSMVTTVAGLMPVLVAKTHTYSFQHSFIPLPTVTVSATTELNCGYNCNTNSGHQARVLSRLPPTLLLPKAFFTFYLL